MLNRNLNMTDAGTPALYDEAAAREDALKVKERALSGTWPADVNQPTTFQPASDTGFKTSEGETIESSYADAPSFWEQMGINNILDNTPSGAMSYQGYLAYNGLVDPRVNYARSLDQANEMYARALGTYGASGEGLAQGNLINAGYSEYLTGLAYQNKANMYSAAMQQLNADEKQTAMQYQQYLNDFEAAKAAEDAAEDAAEVAGQAGVLTERESSIVDILGESGVSPRDIEQALLVMRSKGFTDEEFEHAWQNYTALLASEQDKKIANTKELAAGKANELKEFYGEGDEYEAALGKLQEKNKELVNSAVEAINSGDFDSKAFNQLMAAARESTLTTDKKGNESYNWDSMNETEKAAFFMDTLRDMHDSGDIDDETYQEANYNVISNTIKNALSKKYVFKSGQKKLINALESLAYTYANADAVNEKQKKELIKQVAGLMSSKYYDALNAGGQWILTTEDGSITAVVDHGKAISRGGTLQGNQKLTEPQIDALKDVMDQITDITETRKTGGRHI